MTRPTEGMRRAMAEADVGDDVFGEDPSVNRLEEYVAELLGKEAAIYAPSGTMTNQIGVYVNTGRGDEVLMHEQGSHLSIRSRRPRAALRSSSPASPRRARKDPPRDPAVRCSA